MRLLLFCSFGKWRVSHGMRAAMHGSSKLSTFSNTAAAREALECKSAGSQFNQSGTILFISGLDAV